MARWWCRAFHVHQYASSDETSPVLVCLECMHIYIPKENP